MMLKYEVIIVLANPPLNYLSLAFHLFSFCSPPTPCIPPYHTLILRLFLSVHLCVRDAHINILHHTQTHTQHSHITAPCPHSH